MILTFYTHFVVRDGEHICQIRIIDLSIAVHTLILVLKNNTLSLLKNYTEYFEISVIVCTFEATF